MRKLLSVAATALTLSGGTAAYGQVQIVNNMPGTFMDISGTGTPLSLVDDGEVDIPTTVGNGLLAAGTARVGSNGAVRFAGTALELGFTNAALPSTSCFNGEQTLLPFWDDVNTASGVNGEIYWQEIGGTLIVQWNNVDFFGGGIDFATWQLQVHSSGNSFAQFLYTDIEGPRADSGSSATIGYQAGGVANDVQWSFDMPGAVSNGTVLSLVGGAPPPPPPPPCGSVTIVSSLPGTFMDISGTGTPLSLTDDGEVDIPTTVGNSLLAAGTARVGSNGAVRFAGTALELGFTNAALPSTSCFNGEQTLLPFWDDVNTLSGVNGEIYYQEIGGTLIVQWNNVDFFAGGTDFATWQLQVHSSGSSFAQFIYTDIEGPRADSGASATIGYQAGGLQNDVQWSFDTPGAVMNGTVLSLVPLPGLGTTYCNPAIPNSTGMAATIEACGSDVVANNDLRVTASGLPAGQFGYFLVGRTQGLFGPMNSSGFICLSGDIGRYNAVPQIITGPVGSLTIDLGNLPTNTPGSQTTVPGETLHFQCWYRDGATNNFTDAVSILFL